jgi:hypothetical protein
VAVSLVSAPTSDLIDPQTSWLDAVLAGMAESVSDCARAQNAGEVPDAVRIDRIARLEKIKAAAAALQIAESVRLHSRRPRHSWPLTSIRTRSVAG